MVGIGLILLLIASPDELYQSARDAYKKGDFDTARKSFERFLKDYPEHNFVPNALYWTARLKKDSQDAIKYYEEVLSSYSKSKMADNALYRLAQFYYAKEEYNEALKRYSKIISTYLQGDCVKDAKYWVNIISALISEPAPKTPEKTDQYAVQIVALTDKESAEQFKQRFKEYNPYIIKIGKWYKVRIGYFTSSKAAKDFMRQKGLEGFVVKEKP